MRKQFFPYLLIFCLNFLQIEIPLQAKQKEENVSLKQELATTTIQFKMATDVFNLINQNRTANSLPPLTWLEDIAHQARVHSRNMANDIVPFGHTGFQIRFDKLRKVIPSLTRMGENVAYNFGYSNPAAVAISGWLASPGHYANIMGDFNFTGVGIAKNPQGEYYFTQIFVKADPIVVLQASIKNLDQAKEETIDPKANARISEAPMLIEVNQP